MPRLSRRMFAFLWLILLAALSPGYVRVRMTGTPDGDIDVEQMGFGPKKVRVKGGDGVVESRAW